MKLKHLALSSLAAFTTLLPVVAPIVTPPASAHRLCAKKPWPLKGHWCTRKGHWHPNRGDSSSGSTLQVVTDDKYIFTIYNDTQIKLNYRINNKIYSLSPNHQRTHQYQSARGTNSGNIRTFSRPKITYDRDLSTNNIWEKAQFSRGDRDNVNHQFMFSYSRKNSSRYIWLYRR